MQPAGRRAAVATAGRKGSRSTLREVILVSRSRGKSAPMDPAAVERIAQGMTKQQLDEALAQRGRSMPKRHRQIYERVRDQKAKGGKS